MKLYYLYVRHPNVNDWYDCFGVFENGWIPFRHVCSDLSFTRGDIWRNRPERQETIKKMGIEVEDTGELIDESTIDITHPALLKANQECDQQYFYDLYVKATEEYLAETKEKEDE